MKMQQQPHRSQPPHCARAAPIKFEGELEHLNLLLKEDQQKARRKIAQDRRRGAQPGGRAAEIEKRIEKCNADLTKLSKQRAQEQVSKRRKREQEETEASSKDGAG
jgi:uncharacterized protein with PIN domain